MKNRQNDDNQCKELESHTCQKKIYNVFTTLLIIIIENQKKKKSPKYKQVKSGRDC